tara:strand:+ start:140 stop:604 length:465 start_codon:yes stop_codon:yes gene_type:complete
MKPNLIVLFSFLIIGCSEIDLLEISNEGRLIKLTKVYDCRTMEQYQQRPPFGESHISAVYVYLIDFSNQTLIFHRAHYKNTILETPHEYLLKDSTDDNHRFEQIFYDLTDINESNNFIRFSTMNAKGNKFPNTLNKQTNTLNSGSGFTRTCKVI